MATALPAFADLHKASKDVLYGTKAGEGVFNTALKLSAESVNADGVIFALTATQPPGAAPATSLTTIWSPSKGTTLNAVVTGTGALSVGGTIQDVMGCPGLRASLLASPPSLLASSQLTLDYTGYSPVHLRAILAPKPGTKGWATPAVDLSATTAAGPFLLGAQAAADTASAKVSRWSLGGSWVMSPTQEVGLIYTQDSSAAAASSGASSPFSSSPASSAAVRSLQLHGVQALSDDTVWAGEMTYPLSPTAAQKGAMPPLSVAVGVSRLLASGGLCKAKLSSSGLLSLLYEQKLAGNMGRLGLSAAVDTTQPATAAPLVGFNWSL